MSKRRALTQMTKEDYEREEEEEEAVESASLADASTFVASKEVMERRSIIKAKRRTLAGNDSVTPNSPFPSPFAGIKLQPSSTGTPFGSNANQGFFSQSTGTGTPSSLSGNNQGTGSPFSFGVKNQGTGTPSSLGGNSQGSLFKFGTSSGDQSTPVSVKFGFQSATSSTATPSVSSASNSSPKVSNPNTSPKVSIPQSTAMAGGTVNGTSSKGNGDEETSPEFCTKLSQLNRDFISSLTSSNPSVLFDFSPLCNDYVKYVKELESKYLNKGTSTNVSNLGSSIQSDTNPPKVPSIPITSVSNLGSNAQSDTNPPKVSLIPTTNVSKFGSSVQTDTNPSKFASSSTTNVSNFGSSVQSDTNPSKVTSIPTASQESSTSFNPSVSSSSFSSSVQPPKSSPEKSAPSAVFSSGTSTQPFTFPTQPLTFGPSAASSNKPSFGLSATAAPFVPSSSPPFVTAGSKATSDPAVKDSAKLFSFGLPSGGTTSTAPTSTGSSFGTGVSSTASTGFSFAAAAAASTPKFGATGFDPKATSASIFSFGSPVKSAPSSSGNNDNKPARSTAAFSFGSSQQPSFSSSFPQSSAGASSPFSTAPSSQPSFGSSSLPSFTASKPSSSLFGSPPTPTPLFGSGPNTALALNFKPSHPPSQETDADEEYVPPKVEQINVEEKDSIYSKRIKLFTKGEKTYEAVGIGMLHVKRLETGKYQLIVRGENAIGSVWLNTILAPGNIIKRIGDKKKDVQIATVVTTPPPSSDGLKNGAQEEVKSVIYLIRCTDEKNADELEQKLNEFKG